MKQYLEIKVAFETQRNIEKAKQMAAYMRNQFSYYGLQTPERRRIYQPLLKEARKMKMIDWQFLDQCWEDSHREFQYLVTDYLTALQKELTYEDIERHLKYYATTKQWWDTIDSLDRIIGNIAFVDERVNDLMLAWSKDEDMWLRRIAIDHQLTRKNKTNKELLAQIIVNNLGSEEFFINKAIGWSLRDYSKINPDWVRNFVEQHRLQMAPLSIREACKYL
ncbi:DNA alkylation repair protein [Aerococcaceae bacterium NML201209]|nr:DNA alkylation repair protein [Aerococcaceae bacterium NML201209]MCW6664173.1 DNA alkylation repair protein [Aerococcaceae bacterium NML191219]MCW6666318.1 DNA alkylation repair protein [Aerococcaceae bacterium NML190938]